ncbi:hypothetical protein D3C76_1110390 [compost metagenome]
MAISAGRTPRSTFPSTVKPSRPDWPPLSNAVISLAQAAAMYCRYTAPESGWSDDRCQMFSAATACPATCKDSLRPWDSTDRNGTGFSPEGSRNRKAPRPFGRDSAFWKTWFTAPTMAWLERKFVPSVCSLPAVASRARR